MVVTAAFVRKLFRKRPEWSHKGDFGRLLVIGGSRTYTGSPALVSLAALRTGADWVDVFSPQRAADVAASFSPDLITYPQKGDFLNPWHLKEALELEGKCDAIVMGNGLGRRMETEAFIIKFLEKTSKPCVIDADAIHTMARKKQSVKNNFILTPHAHEFFILTGTRPTANANERAKIVRKAAKEFNCTILLKGHIDVISDGSWTEQNRTGNPFMTKAGTGDMLAGICGAMLAMGAKPFEAACAAAYINGLAGDIVAKKSGQSLLASDLLAEIQSAFKAR